jgi:oxygen-dependent protoporphyrinogen oxidase
MRDVVIVGGGIAGLAAGWRLRHRDMLLLESEPRLGGRIRSERRGSYWLNWGGHVYAGGDSATSSLLRETGIESVPVPGSLAGLAMNGRLLIGGRVETYPFRVPMPWSSRLALLAAGAKVSAAVARYARVVKRRPGEDQATRQRRIYAFMNDRSFADFIGDLPPDAEALFTPTVTRSSADIDQISAGAGVGYFSLVWNIGGGLSQSIVGGPSTLTEGIGTALGDRVQRGATVHEVVVRNGIVEVRYTQDGTDRTEQARCVVMATPATVTHRVAVDLPEDVRAALGQIVYGPYVSAAFLTDESGPQVWDTAYAIATPKRSFTVVLNMSNVVRGSESERRPGSSLMAFSPAALARGLLEQDDETIRARYLDDLDQVLPGVAGTVVEAHVQRWPTGAPYCFPGRGRLQPALTRRTGPVVLAGDYLGTFYTETAISTGLSAAQEVQSLLVPIEESR